MTTNADVLATVDAARARTRQVRRAGWIPLVVFGILVLPALAFHLQTTVSDTIDTAGHDIGLVRYPFSNTNGGNGLFWYWQIAIPLGYLLVAGIYALRNRRAGVRSPVRTYVATGVVLVVALYYFANTAVAPLHWSNFGLHGMEATITIGLALFVLAWTERSAALAVSALLVTGAALAASQYDIENLWYRLFGLQIPDWLSAGTNDLALSAVLLLCAAVVAFVDRARSRPVPALAVTDDPA